MSKAKGGELQYFKPLLISLFSVYSTDAAKRNKVEDGYDTNFFGLICTKVKPIAIK